MVNAQNVIEKLLNKSVIYNDLRYCLVDENKHPYKIDNSPARPNHIEDFVDFITLAESDNLKNYAGLGISIQASNICAIDIDKCFSIPNDINSGDDRADYFLEKFKDIAYCEFSFSGTGLRILFKCPIITDYSDKYYIKNEKYKIEYYQPYNSYRYVTITGNSIYDSNLEKLIDLSCIYEFLNKFMVREYKEYEIKTYKKETRNYDELMKIVRQLYFKDNNFQNLWFDNAPGSGKNESERDYHLVAYLFENVTQDENLIKQIFESSNFFKTKDYKHLYKWNYNNFRYFKYLIERVNRRR